MRLYPCPVCGQEPTVGRASGEEVRWRAECWCSLAYGRTQDELERIWNRYYCANDPVGAGEDDI